MIEYLAGSGLAVVGEHAVAFLPDGSPPAVLDALWVSMRASESLTDHLEVLLSPGLSAAPAFAIVQLIDGQAQVIVRGAARATVTTSEGLRSISGEQVSTWTEETITGVLAVRLGNAGHGQGRSLPVVIGVVPASEVRIQVNSENAPAVRTRRDRVKAVPAPSPASSITRTDSALDDSSYWDEPSAPESERGGHVDVGGEDSRRPVHDDLEPVDGLVGSPPVDDLVQDGSAVPSWEPVPVPYPSTNGTASVSASDHDGMTVLSSDVVELRRALPEWAENEVPQLEVPTANRTAPGKLLMSTGLVVSLNRPVLIGRAPQASASNADIPRLITVASPNQDISRTHCEVRMDDDDVVVTDLHSTNGILLLRQGAGAQRLHPGEATVVESGVVVDLGEGVTFLVEAGG
jgi:resuscitation-promoting factor RpfA